jgi:hypothetical protein
MENTLEKYREDTNWTDWYMSGGCYTFADALYHYNKKRGTFFAVEEKDTDTMAHVVLYVNGEYCDYNGCRTKSEILNDVTVNYPIQWRKVNRNEVISQWNYDANEVKKITNKLKEIDMKLTKEQLKEIIREEAAKLDEPSPFYQSVFYSIYRSISKNSKNSRLKNLSAEVANHLTDIFERIENNELAIGEFFNKIRKI